MPFSADPLRATCADSRTGLDQHAVAVVVDPKRWSMGGMFHNLTMKGADVSGTLFFGGSFHKAGMVGVIGLSDARFDGARVRESPGAVGLPGADQIVPVMEVTRQRDAFYKGGNKAMVDMSRGRSVD